MFPDDYSAVNGYSQSLPTQQQALKGGVLHLKGVFFDFHISEWSKPDQIRSPEPNMIFNVNFGSEIQY